MRGMSRRGCRLLGSLQRFCSMDFVNPLNPELNPICHVLALLGAHHFLHVSRVRVKLLTFRLLMSYIYIYIYIYDISRLGVNQYFLLLSQDRLKRLKKDVSRYFLTFASLGSVTLSVIICAPCFRPKSGSMLLYSRKKVRYRRDGYCWKKRKDGKTTREDHMKLKVQGTEVSLSFQTLLV